MTVSTDRIVSSFDRGPACIMRRLRLVPVGGSDPRARASEHPKPSSSQWREQRDLRAILRPICPQCKSLVAIGRVAADADGSQNLAAAVADQHASGSRDDLAA